MPSRSKAAYLPLARKHRPQTFAELVGQPHITETLARALQQQRVAQAYLFAGPRGVGKTSAARILAKCLNCERGPAATPCGACAGCAQITQGNSLDVIEIDGASNRGIEEVRRLRETVQFAPAVGAFRIYIIDEVHMLTPEAFNALLKTLEEPPAHAKFFFATTAPGKVPATVLSRCQRFDFRRLDAETIVQQLQRVVTAERLSADPAALYAIARASDGSLRDAEVILDQLAGFSEGPMTEAGVTELLGTVPFQAMTAWTQAILDRQPLQALALLTEQMERGKDPAQLLAGLLHHLRNLVVLRAAEGRQELVAKLIDGALEDLQQLSAQASEADAQDLLMLTQLFAGAHELVRRSPMAQTVLELTVVKASTREQWQSLDQLLKRLEGGAPISPRAEAPAPPAQPKTMPIPEPAAASAGQAVLSAPEAWTSLWPKFLDRLGKKKMSLAAYLMDGKPVAADERTLTVGLPAFALHQEVLNVPDHRRLIEEVLKELVGRPTSVQYTTLPESAPAEASPGRPAAASESAVEASSPLVQDIVSLFNATVISQAPKPAP